MKISRNTSNLSRNLSLPKPTRHGLGITSVLKSKQDKPTLSGKATKIRGLVSFKGAHSLQTKPSTTASAP